MPRLPLRVPALLRAILAILAGCLLLAGSVAHPACAEPTDAVDRDYSAEMPRLPPVEPAAALATFEVEPGFRLELAAAEPQVADPVAMEFDEHGRLYVVEMLGYSEDADQRLGRVRLLEDADRDGRFEKSTVYAHGLAWPTALCCYGGGLFVGAAPDILYFKDADGDGRADEQRVVFTGFGTSNVQGLLNSFRWGFDCRIHVAVSSCGAELRRADQPQAEPLILRGRNFAFDPRTLEFEATSGASQHGMCFDSWGNQFTCSNSDHIQQVMFEERQLARNPFWQPPAVVKSIAAEGPAADVYRISLVEPWREIRTRLRTKGIVPGIVEGGGRAAGYFTSATGVTIYAGDAWPREYLGNAFIGDVGSNLVHRKIIAEDPSAVPLVARRATPGREFVASRDTWFRPVQFAHGPDGNLYILDMYREVIEHPDSLPPVLKRHLDLTSGRDRGRIYRVVAGDYSPAAYRQRMSHGLPGDASTEDLVAMLTHNNGWHRTTAARLLYERNDPAARTHLERLMFGPLYSPAGRILAAYLMAESEPFAQAAMLGFGDGNREFRRHSVRLMGRALRELASEAGDEGKELPTVALANVAAGGDRRFRFEAALALGDSRHPARLQGLKNVLCKNPEDDYLAAAVFSSLAEDAEQLVHLLLQEEGFTNTPAGRRRLAELCRQIGARGDGGELASLARDVVQLPAGDSALGVELLAATVRGAGPERRAVREKLAVASNGAIDRLLAALVERSLAAATDDAAAITRRVAAVEVLALGELAAVEAALAELLAARHPQQIQVAALSALGQFDAADASPAILAAWPGMGPLLRSQAADLLLGQGTAAAALLEAVAAGAVAPRDLDPSAIQRLKTHADAAVRAEAMRLLDAAESPRAEVVAAYRDVLELTGDAARGQEHFRQHCAICHRRDGFGTEVGADLATVVTRTPEALLISLLDPNREVDPRYVQYTVLTVDGLAKSGMIATETATSVTLRREENVTETIPRSDVQELRSTGMTLMPEGFEKTLDRQALADLIAYLQSEPPR